MTNIESKPASEFEWRSDDVKASLALLFNYVVEASRATERWYWDKKKKKARGASIIQSLAVCLTALAALIPVASKLGLRWPGAAAIMKWLGVEGTLDPGLVASFLVGTAAAVIGFDRLWGLSSGWARFVLTATSIHNSCEEFRMDWATLTAQLDTKPRAEQVLALIESAKAFRMTVESMVLKETQDWATEFRNNVAQLETDLKVKADKLRVAQEQSEKDKALELAQQKAAREKAAQELAQANLPGSIAVTVVNAANMDDFRFEAQLATTQAVVAEGSAVGSQTWVHVGVPPGHYKLTISAARDKRAVAAMGVALIKPGETAQLAITLPEPAKPPEPPSVGSGPN